MVNYRSRKMYRFAFLVKMIYWDMHASVFLTLEDTILLSQNLGGMKASVAEQER